MRMRKVILFSMLLSMVFSKEPYTYVYLLPFDNIQNDPAVEWIAAGLSDNGTRRDKEYIRCENKKQRRP